MKTILDAIGKFEARYKFEFENLKTRVSALEEKTLKVKEDEIQIAFNHNLAPNIHSMLAGQILEYLKSKGVTKINYDTRNIPLNK